MTEPTPHAPRTTLAHLSDVHFGRISDPGVVEALVAEVNGGGHALVVVSGDLTQRARTAEFRAARAFLGRFEPPVLVVPGNHDVPALHHAPITRLFDPADRYERHVTDNLRPTFEAPGLAAFGLNSSHGWTVKGGRVRRRDLAAMGAFFRRQPERAFRVFVLHHHLLRLAALGDHDVSRGAERAIAAARRARVDLVLCGHLHVSHVEAVELAPPDAADPDGHRVVVASAGTATSDRGRGPHARMNWYNVVEVGERSFTVRERRFDAAAGAFAEAEATTFARDHRSDEAHP